MRQYAYTCIDKYLLDHSQYVHSKLLELISHFCVNFLVNPPGRQITPYYIFFFSKYVSLTDQNSSWINKYNAA